MEVERDEIYRRIAGDNKQIDMHRDERKKVDICI
jgi:hypothetical protein